MPSDLERAVSAYRDDLDRLDAAAEGRLLRAYDSAKTNILQRVNDLAPAITDGTASPGAVYQDARYRALLDDIEREVAGFARTTGQVVASGQGQAVAMAGEQAAGLVAAQAPRVAAGFARVPVGALTEMVGVLGDGSPLASLLDTYGPQARAAAGPILTNAVTTGASPLQIAGNLADALDVLQWRAERLARTEMLRAFRNAALRNYQANAHLLRGWRWLCAKSQRTCFACLAMDGRIFPLSRSMAEHVQGRCTQIPLVKGYPDPDIETGAAWFARQDAATQQAMFTASGKKALYQPYKAGRLGLDDMVTYQDDARWGGAFSEASAKASLNAANLAKPAAPAVVVPGTYDNAPYKQAYDDAVSQQKQLAVYKIADRVELDDAKFFAQVKAADPAVFDAYKKFESSALKKAAPVATLSLAPTPVPWVATQDNIDLGGVQKHLGAGIPGATGRPTVVKWNDEYLIEDGHHRFAAARIDGKPTLDVQFIDLDAIARAPDAVPA